MQDFVCGDKPIMKTSPIWLFVLYFNVIGSCHKSIDDGFNPNCSYQSCTNATRTCQCDSLCPYFRDCCEDYGKSHGTSTSLFWKNFPQNRFLECRSIPGKWEKYRTLVTTCPDSETTYWMVGRCPSTTSMVLKEQCEVEHPTNALVKVSYLRPVHDALGNVFKNYYCARCHDVPSEEIILWSVNQVCWDCPDQLPLSQNHYANLSESHCPLLLETTEKERTTNSTNDVKATLRECVKNMISSCPPGSNSNDSKMCSEFMSPGYFKGFYFKNIFCAKCRGLENELSWSCESLEPCFSILGVSGAIQFSALIQCQFMRCSRPHNLCDAKRQYISIVVDDSLKCSYLEERAEQCFFKKSLFMNDSMLPWEKMVGSNPLWDTKETRKHQVTVFQLPANVSTDWRIRLDAYLLSNARGLSVSQRSCYIEYIEVVEVCSNQDWEKLGECNGDIIHIEDDRILDDKSLLTELQLNFTDEMFPVWYSVHTSFPFESNSSAVKHTSICFQYSRRVQRRRNIFYKIFCGICIGGAIVGHLATFFTYALVKPLRNTFGVSLMSFVMSLMLALGLLEFVNEYVINVTHLCQAVAIVSHFFWIASFTWMSVLAWDLHVTLSLSKVRVRKPSSRKRLVAYCCFGWGVPLLVVATCVTLWLWNFHGLTIKYGPVKNFTCWLSDGIVVLAAVAGPLVLCLQTNVILLFLVARSLYKHKKSSKMLDAEKDAKQNKRKFVELIIYVKITMLMGFSWMFGILADFTTFEVLWWFFYLSYLIQAVLTFAFFGLSPRAREMWRSSRTTNTRTSITRLSS